MTVNNNDEQQQMTTTNNDRTMAMAMAADNDGCIICYHRHLLSLSAVIIVHGCHLLSSMLVVVIYGQLSWLVV